MGLRLPSYKRSLVIVLLICAGYYLGGILGIRARLSPTGSSALWPPNAILLAALLLTPIREWWIYLLATAATHLHLTSNFQGNVPLLVMLCQVVGNSLTVYVTHEEGVGIIDVEDQGKGFVPDALDLPRSHGGFGLFSIRERLSLLGGGLEIKSSPGNGTSAQVVIPVAATDPAGALPNLAS